MNGTDEQNRLLFLFQIQSSCVLQTLVRYQKWGFFFYSLGDISRKMTEYLWLNLHVYLAWAGISWGIHFFYLPWWEWHHFYPFRSLYLTPNLLFFVLYLLLPVAHQSFAYPVSGTYLGEVIVPFSVSVLLSFSSEVFLHKVRMMSVYPSIESIFWEPFLWM